MKLVFSTQKYQYLLDKVLALGEFERGEIEVKYFPDGERYQRILNEVDRREVVLIGGTVSDSDTLELYDIACAVEKHGGTSLTLVIPYYGYSTMERAVKKGEIVTAKTRARLLSAIPNTGKGNHIMLFDLHTEGLPHYFEGNIRPIHLYCKDLIIEACHELAGQDFILACTDAGRAKWVESLANDMGVNGAFVFKRRISGDTTEITSINADVKGRTVIVYDDMIRTGGSLINAAKSYYDAGAERIFVITTHGLFNNNGLEKIKNSGLVERVVSTDTHYNVTQIQDDFLQVKTIAGLIVKKLNEL
ncbi:MAG: ribose-phosphate diphosphokinase [Microscillaceae bacterium]|jgi:ribose-phosphate pyrophosphokinase|nr:ribose-phosphate diphosphokinase [Microscillaceae bacterium]